MMKTTTIRTRIRVLLLTGLVLLPAATSRAGFWSEKKEGKKNRVTKELTDPKIIQNLDAQLPLDLTFTDENGRKVQLGDYFGQKPVLLTMAYFNCPMLCTQVLQGVEKCANVLDFDMGEDYEMLTISIDPLDRPADAQAQLLKLKGWYRRAPIAGKWHFLMGDSATIAKVSKVVGFKFVKVPGKRQYAHAAGAMVVTPQGRMSRYFYGIDFAPKDMKLALIEATGGKIGSPVNAILCLCYQYDPSTGTYGLVISRVLQLAGGATLLVMGGFMFVWIRHERRKRRREEAASAQA